MLYVNRVPENPVLKPNSKNDWEAAAAFNGAAALEGGKFHMLYRAISKRMPWQGQDLQISSIGYASSEDGVNYDEHINLIKPEESWEKFGCEDPRITKLGDKYFIFYTAIGEMPLRPEGIRVAVATTHELGRIESKHLVTPFNGKAMAMFPERVNGKIAVIFSAHTDQPPVKTSIAYFDKEEDLWSEEYWRKWHEDIDRHNLELRRSDKDHVEIGAPPILTSEGWLLIYSYIKDYFDPRLRTFRIEAALLDLQDPRKVIARTTEPLLTPEADYELKGMVPDIVFPSGAVLKEDELSIFYGGADNVCCVAKTSLKELLKEMLEPHVKFVRFPENPIITSRKDVAWESRAVFNPCAVQEGGKIHLFYRAMSEDNTSVVGYAVSEDGLEFKLFSEPAYGPRASFEAKLTPGGNSGCEDPRLVGYEGRYYMMYTAYDGQHPPRVALTSIEAEDLAAQKWNWADPVLISPPGKDDKDACLHPEKIDGRFGIYHRIGVTVDLALMDDLIFTENEWLPECTIFGPRPGRWDGEKVGISGPPIKTEEGWLLFYHGVSRDHIYRVGAVLLDLTNPRKVLYRTRHPLLEPEADYEKIGQVNNVVFPCGQAVIDGTVYLYYGGADQVICLATAKIEDILKEVKR